MPILKTLLMAGGIVLEILTSDLHRMVDYQSSLSYFEASMAVLRSCSVKENDLQIRAADILTYGKIPSLKLTH